MEKVSDLSVEGIVARLHAEGFLVDKDPEKFYPADYVNFLTVEELYFLSQVLPGSRLLPSQSRAFGGVNRTKRTYSKGEVSDLDQRLKVAGSRIVTKKPGAFRQFPHVVLGEVDDVRRVLQRLLSSHFGIVVPDRTLELPRVTGDEQLDKELEIDKGFPYFSRVEILELPIPARGLPVVQLDFNVDLEGICDLKFAVLVLDHGRVSLRNDTDSGPEILTPWTFAKAS